MRSLFSLLYWSAVTVLWALVMLSLGYDFSSGLLIGTAFLPGAFSAKYLFWQVGREQRGTARVWGVVIACAVILAVEYLTLFCTHWYMLKTEAGDFPRLLLNPVFVAMVLVAYALPEWVLSARLFQADTTPRIVEFVCNRHRMQLPTDTIAYIESNDDEVWVHTVGGDVYRTHMTISHWSTVLGDGFVRVYRSFLVNRSHIETADRMTVTVGGRRIEISRKYRDAIK